MVPQKHRSGDGGGTPLAFSFPPAHPQMVPVAQVHPFLLCCSSGDAPPIPRGGPHLLLLGDAKQVKLVLKLTTTKGHMCVHIYSVYVVCCACVCLHMWDVSGASVPGCGSCALVCLWPGTLSTRLSPPGCPGMWDNITCWKPAQIGEMVLVSCPEVFRIFNPDQGKWNSRSLPTVLVYAAVYSTILPPGAKL